MTLFAYLLQDMPGARQEFVEDPRVNRRPVGGHLNRTPTSAQRVGEECPRGRAVAALREQNIIT